MSTLALIFGAFVLLACGAGYWFYASMQVDPIAVEPGASEVQRIAAVERWLDDQFDKHRFNGGVLLVRDGQVLLSKTCGFTDQSSKQRLNEHSAFRLASVSKQFTAACVLRLANMGLLNLDDPVAKHLSGFFSDKVTIRHLLNQTSGIPDDYWILAEEHRETLGDVLTISDVVELVKEHSKLECPPGTAEEYSNTNYVLLAGIVETASGKSFEQFMQKELFDPLGMNDSQVWTLLSADRSPNQVDDFDQEEQRRVETTWLDGVAGLRWALEPLAIYQNESRIGA